jgi:hypothetical protein
MLPEDKRKQLDGIVQKMIQNKESDSNIQFVVDDFKKKYTPIEAPVQQPKQKGFVENVAAGVVKPFARLGTNLVNAKQIAFGEQKTQPFSGDFLGEVKPVGQSGSFGADLKDALGTGLDVASNIPIGGGVAGVAKAGLKGAVKQGIKTGVKAGATAGAMQGAGGSLQEDQGIGGFVGNTLLGGAAGGVMGAATGGALPAASKGINRLTPGGRAAAAATKTQNHALDLVSPKVTSEVSEQAIKQGRVTEPKFMKKAKIIPSKKDYELADSIKDVVSTKKTVLQNTDAIDKKIREINKGVKEYVKKNKVPFNTNQLKSRLNSGKDELKLIFASDTNAENTYNAVVDEFMKHVASKDTEGLLDARQILDKIPSIKKLLDSQGLGENVKKEVVLTVRRKANEYISDLLPQGNPYKPSLLKQTKMIEAIENIAEKHKGIIGKNNLQILAQRYPALKWVVGSAAVGALGGAGVGVGGALISSTD